MSEDTGLQSTSSVPLAFSVGWGGAEALPLTPYPIPELRNEDFSSTGEHQDILPAAAHIAWGSDKEKPCSNGAHQTQLPSPPPKRGKQYTSSSVEGTGNPRPQQFNSGALPLCPAPPLLPAQATELVHEDGKSSEDSQLSSQLLGVQYLATYSGPSSINWHDS